MKNKKWMTLFVVLVLGSLVMAACGPTTPEVIEKEVTRVVEKEVTRAVKETVVAESTPEVVEVEVTRVVTATPEPEPEPTEESGTEGEAAQEPAVPDEPDRCAAGEYVCPPGPPVPPGPKLSPPLRMPAARGPP